MRYITILVLFLLFLCSACQKNLRQGLIESALGPEKQQFTVTIGTDTIIRCKGGMVLHFCTNTFVCSENKFILEVQEVHDRGAAFLLGMSTVATGGALLETEGMVHLNGITSGGSTVTINPDCPVRVEMPVKGRRPGVRWFKGNTSDAGILWTEIPDGFDNQLDINQLVTGKQLFQTLCTNCHCPALDGPSTGPALGNITQFRDKIWLRAFTRNSQELIISGDSIALCSWNRYKPSVMSSFTQLTDEQIDAIYQYITEESARRNLQIDKTYYDCSYVQSEHAEDTSSTIQPAISGNFKPNPYFGKIYELGWHNCDLFINDSTAQPATIQVTIPNPQQYDEVLAGVLLDDFNANIQLEEYADGQFETVREWGVKLPQVPARIVVIGITGKRWFKYEQPFTIGTNNTFTAMMLATSEKKMKAFIESRAFKASDSTNPDTGPKCISGW